MSRIQLAGLTNEELAQHLDTIGVISATPEELQHAALRLIEIVQQQKIGLVSMRELHIEGTPVSFVLV
jgi:hypothetical protein